MAVNSSNASLLLPHLPSSGVHIIHCMISPPSSFVYFSFYTTNVLLFLPLCIFILYLGLQRWRQQRSTSTPISHLDSFTYHMVVMEMVGISGRILSCYGIYNYCSSTVWLGYSLCSFTWIGESFFHVLTCVERYLAVVHPVTYLSLRNERGIRLRNISIGCVWFFCFLGTNLLPVQSVITILDLCLMVFFIVLIFFCSLSVLCTLIRPTPGEQGRVGQSKQKAFYTILVVLGVLLLRFGWNLVWLSLLLTKFPNCVTLSLNIWFNLPCSLVLPLLFLYRAGKLAKNLKI